MKEYKDQTTAKQNNRRVWGVTLGVGIVVIAAVATTVPFVLKYINNQSNAAEKQNALEEFYDESIINGEIITTKENHHGNKILKPGNLESWSITTNSFFKDKSKANLVHDIKLVYTDYDFAIKRVVSRVTYRYLDKKYYRNVKVSGFAQPKIMPANPDQILGQEFRTYVIPKNFQGFKTATSIGGNAFESARLPDDFQIPDSVTSIGERIFMNARLPKQWKNPAAWNQTITRLAYYRATLQPGFSIPTTVTTLAEGAFASAKVADDFRIPDSVKTIGLKAIASMNISSYWHHPLAWAKAIPREAYLLVDLPDNFKIPTTVDQIGFKAFGGTHLPRNFKIPTTVSQVDSTAFEEAIIPVGYQWYDATSQPISSINTTTNFPQGGWYLGLVK